MSSDHRNPVSEASRRIDAIVRYSRQSSLGLDQTGTGTIFIFLYSYVSQNVEHLIRIFRIEWTLIKSKLFFRKINKMSSDLRTVSIFIHINSYEGENDESRLKNREYSYTIHKVFV